MNNIDKFFNQDAEKFADAYLSYLSSVLQVIDRVEIRNFIDVLLTARKNRASIFFIGNGGSASTATHFANDLAVGTNSYDKPFRAISLTDNQAIITAIGNDFGFEEVYLRQLQLLAKPGDVVVAISASGNSLNLIKAFEYAKVNEIRTFAITGFDGGKMKLIADGGIHVPTESKEYGPAEDAHLVIDHLVANYLSRLINQKPDL